MPSVVHDTLFQVRDAFGLQPPGTQDPCVRRPRLCRMRAVPLSVRPNLSRDEPKPSVVCQPLTADRAEVVQAAPRSATTSPAGADEHPAGNDQCEE
jgi:hypothetical protein